MASALEVQILFKLPVIPRPILRVLNLSLDAILNWAKGDSFSARVGRVASAVVVYCVWQERSQRIFQKYIELQGLYLKTLTTILGDKTWGLDDKVMI